MQVLKFLLHFSTFKGEFLNVNKISKLLLLVSHKPKLCFLKRIVEIISLGLFDLSEVLVV